MAQFEIHKNKNPRTKAVYPYLVDVQSDLLRDLQTRVVVPLTRASAIAKRPIRDLTPMVDVDGQKFAMLIPQMAGIARMELGQSVGTLGGYRDEIVAAIDFLITGI